MKIEGYFGTIKNANNTVEALKKEGITKAFSDINEHYSGDVDPETNLAGTDSGPSLSELVLHSGATTVDRREAPLMAASPMISGMGGFEEIEDINYRVVVETDSTNEKKVKQIIKDMGGEIENPNINLPKHIKDINLEDAVFDDIDI